MWTITRLRLKQDRRGVSNIIVVVLSLVIIVAIIADIVLWNYEMNQVDWEKIKENTSITNVERITHSSWFVTQSEYALNTGSRTSGTYMDTQVIDSNYERFSETSILDLNGTLTIDLPTYPLEGIKTIEIRLRYKTDDPGEKWYLRAYNWFSSSYSDSGFNYTVGHTPTTGWDDYAVNLTDEWPSYVQDDGTIYVKFVDEGADSNQTTIDIDFLGVRAEIDGARFTFKNGGALTSHLVSLWIINSTDHRRHDIDVFINSAETKTYIRTDISLPEDQYTVKVVTERGNTAVY